MACPRGGVRQVHGDLARPDPLTCGPPHAVSGGRGITGVLGVFQRYPSNRTNWTRLSCHTPRGYLVSMMRTQNGRTDMPYSHAAESDVIGRVQAAGFTSGGADVPGFVRFVSGLEYSH